MTLGQRLLAATAILTVATTLVFGVAVREAWRRTEETRFRAEFHVAVAELRDEVRRELAEMSENLAPLCKHDPLVDSALVGRRSGDLESRRLSISLRVPEMMRANGLDELSLVTEDGEILGQGHHQGSAGRRDPALSARASAIEGRPLLREAEPRAWEVSCKRGSGSAWVALIAARYVDPLLERGARRHGLTLSLESDHEQRAKHSSGALSARVELPELGGEALIAKRSRTPLLGALRQLDITIAALGVGTLLLALLLSTLVSRGLARPVVEFARQARSVVRGTPEPIEETGGKELAEAAQAFNQTLADLAQLRKRLAVTERIAARREVARRVAHEIKNPLAPIRASIETLRRLHARRDERFDEYFDEATRTVLDEVARINHIVSEFTHYARLPEPTVAPFDLVETVRSVVGLHESQGIPINLVAHDCPQVHGDRDQVVQVITNLLSNARDAASSAPTPRIEVGVGPSRTSDDPMVSIRVTDNGPGVEPAMIDRLFEPYATNKAHGTGLGLAIAQRIAVEHGGEVVYEQATKHGGASFVLRLPVDGPPRLPGTPHPPSGSEVPAPH